MAKKQRLVYRVTPIEGGWKVQLNKQWASAVTFLRENKRTKADAIKFARGAALDAKPSQLVVHKRDGRIQTEWTFGDDPRLTKG